MLSLISVAGIGFKSLPPEAQRTLLISLVPAVLVVIACIALIVFRWKHRDVYWVAALVTAPLTVWKVVAAWLMESLATFIFPFSFVFKGLSLFTNFPEVLVYSHYLEKAQRTGVPWVQAATLWAPVGSILVGALLGFALRNSLKTATGK